MLSQYVSLEEYIVASGIGNQVETSKTTGK